MCSWRFSKALHILQPRCWTRFAPMPNSLNLLYREEEREIAGATKLRQLDDAALALALTLSPEDIAALEASYVTHAVGGFT